MIDEVVLLFDVNQKPELFLVSCLPAARMIASFACLSPKPHNPLTFADKFGTAFINGNLMCWTAGKQVSPEDIMHTVPCFVC